MMRVTLFLWIVWFFYWWLASLKTPHSDPSESRFSRGARILFIAAAFLLIFSDAFRFGLLGRRFLPQRCAIELFGLALTVTGLLLAVWARVHLGRYWSGQIEIKAEHRLIATGPYLLIRHPIYAGFLLAVLGSAITLGELRGPVIILAALAACWRKIRLEEQALRLRFREEYEDYRRQTKALVPFLL